MVDVAFLDGSNLSNVYMIGNRSVQFAYGPRNSSDTPGRFSRLKYVLLYYFSAPQN